MWVEGIGLGRLMCSDFGIRSCNKGILVGRTLTVGFKHGVYLDCYFYSIVLLFS